MAEDVGGGVGGDTEASEETPTVDAAAEGSDMDVAVRTDAEDAGGSHGPRRIGRRILLDSYTKR